MAKNNEEKDITDTVRRIWMEAKQKGQPVALSVSTPNEYAIGYTLKYVPKKKVDNDDKGLQNDVQEMIFQLHYSFIEMMLKYVKPKEMKGFLDQIFETYEKDNYEKFLLDDIEDEDKK